MQARSTASSSMTRSADQLIYLQPRLGSRLNYINASVMSSRRVVWLAEFVLALWYQLHVASHIARAGDIHRAHGMQSMIIVIESNRILAHKFTQPRTHRHFLYYPISFQYYDLPQKNSKIARMETTCTYISIGSWGKWWRCIAAWLTLISDC